ncbi:MAG: hypothetical protein VR64_00060 [Desulfatitalea sp. BRH_c12]|nr:MAG: hypothetical protein VR64_00060 [Desulfatitalea sp. BRH_c12]
MLKIGSYNDLVVAREVDFGLYLVSGDAEVLLPAKYVPEGTRVGDPLKVFVYTDSEDRPVATTLTPKGVVGEFAYLKVTDVADFGAFMDWGLEKDLLVPNSQQQVKMKAGQRYVVKVCLDAGTQRVYASSKVGVLCEEAAPGTLAAGQQVDLLVYGVSKLGVMAVVDHRYAGLIYRDEVYQLLRVGDRRQGYVNRVRDDGKIDVTLKKPGPASIGGSGEVIMSTLQRAGGAIACHDKSPPDLIRQTFAMSKKEFKRAIGALYKSGRIEISDKGIRLKTSV